MVTQRRLILPLLSSWVLAATGCYGGGGYGGGGGDYSGPRGTSTAQCTSDKRRVVEAGTPECGSGPSSTSHLIYFENTYTGCIEAGGVWYNGATALEARECAQADSNACRGGLQARTASEVRSYSCSSSGGPSESLQATSAPNATSCYQGRNPGTTGTFCG